MPKLSALPKENGKVRYRGRLWEVDTPVESDRPGKKKMVLARKGDEVRLIHFGDSSMKDYTQHESKSRRANYLARSAGIRGEDGKPTKDNPFSPNYWSRKVLWGARKDGMGTLLERIDSAIARLDARAGMTLCTPGKTVPCGKVCRTPKNCKKGGKGREAITKEVIQEYATARRAQRKAQVTDAPAPPKRTTKQTAKAAPKTVAPVAMRDSDVTIKLVDVSAIAPPKKLATDKATQRLADDLIKAKGSMSAPVIVVRDGVNSFRVADDPENNKLASAAFLAKQKDPRAGEMANAFIAESDDEARMMLAQRKGFKVKDAIAVPGGKIQLVDVSAVATTSGTASEGLAKARNAVGNTSPVVLREVAPNQYEVESGHDAYASMQLAKSINPRRAEMFSAYVVPRSRKDSLMERIDSLLERFDQRGTGVPCGKSWIPRGAKCSKEKARQTSTEARQRGAEKAREYNKLRGEVKTAARDKRKSKLRVIDGYKGRMMDFLNEAEAESQKNAAEIRAKMAAAKERKARIKWGIPSGEGYVDEVQPNEADLISLRSGKRSKDDLPELEDLFIQADRVGNKYQSKGERDRFQQAMNTEVEAIANLTDQQLPDEAMEAIDFSGRRSTQRAIAYDKVRKALPVNPGTRIPGKAGEILGKPKKSQAEFEQAKRDIQAKQAARRSLETPAETVVAEVVGAEAAKPTVGGAKKRINDLLAKVKQGQEADAKLSAQMAGTALSAVQELASVRGEDLTPIELGQSAPTPMKKPRGSTKQRVNALLDQLKENQQKSSAIDAGFLTVAQVASNELAKEADEMAIAEMGKALEGAETKALPAAKKKRKSDMNDRINNASQRSPRKPKTIKGVSID